MRVVLASASPARLSVLRAAGLDPDVEVSDFDEEGLLAAMPDATPAAKVTALASAKFMMDSEWLNGTVTAKLRLADAAVHRVAQRDLTAEIDLMRVEIAKRISHLDDAIASANTAMAGFAARGRLRAELRAGLVGLELRQKRASADDLVAIPQALAPIWAVDAEQELTKIPFFVRGKARRNTERFARERGVPTITVETLYDAKSHFSR